MTPGRPAGALPLGGYYLLYFSTVGVILPFLPPFFRALDLTGTEIGLLLALQPAMMLFAPPLWGYLADTTGRPDRVLAVVSVGALLGFLPMTAADGFWGLAAAMAVYAFFVSSVTTLVDSLTLHRVAVVGGSYSRIRMFGSLGFVLSTVSFGLAVKEVDRRVVFVAAGLMALYAGWSLFLRAQSQPGPRTSVFAGLALLRNRDLSLMLVASALHWIAGAPYHGIFGIHVVALGLPPWVIGVSAGLGVVAEIAVMWLYPHFAQRLAPRHVLLVAFLSAVLRWAAMAVAESPWVIVGLQVLHGLTFGAFFVAAVAFVANRVPAHQRSSGQALLVSITFGLGGLLGYFAAGTGYEWLGGHRLFAVAAVLQLLPAFLILGVGRPARTQVVESRA